MKSLFRNPLVGVVVPGLLLVIGAVHSLTDADRQERQALARDAAETAVRQRLEESQTEARDRLAVTRYQGACTYIPEAQLAPGLVLVGPGGQPLVDGTAVCDAFGTTAVIAEGVTADLARTSDQSVVRSFLGW
jgi:hypothetical protein